MKTMKKLTTLLLTVVLCISMVGCSTSNLVTALNAVSDASSVAVVVTSSLVALGKVSPDVAAQVSTYAQGVSKAVTVANAELNSSDTNPVKITVITAAFAQVATPAFSNAPEVSAAISAVSVAVQIFLNQLTSSGVLTLARTSPDVKIKMSVGDKLTLHKMMGKVAKTDAAAKLLLVKK